jgi:dolichol-phosphate mannosyltransferase
MSVSNPSPMVTGLSIVIPAYDELLNLRELVPEIKQVTQQLQNFFTEILIVLPSIAKPEEIQEIKNFGATVVMRQPTDSFGDALRSGFAALSDTSEFVLVMDADYSHNPLAITRLLAASSGAHVVVASRYTHGGTTANSLLLKIMSRLLNLAYSIVLGINCRDISTNYKLYRRSDIKNIVLICKDFDIVEEILFKVKSIHGWSFVVREVPDHFYERKFGVTKRQLRPFIISYFRTLVRLKISSKKK